MVLREAIALGAAYRPSPGPLGCAGGGRLGLSAMAARTALISNGARPGCFDMISATMPATCGAAMLFPVATVEPPSFASD